MYAGLVPTLSWNRVPWGPIAWSSSQTNIGLDGIPSGSTYLRVRFAWGFGGITSTSVVAPSIMAVPMVFGLATTIGNGTEPKPDVITFPNDQSPPSERWIWHERRWPTVVGWDAVGGSAVWASTQPQEPADSHGQVLAPTGMGAGNTLNLWACFRASANWDPTGVAQVFGWANVLVKTPL